MHDISGGSFQTVFSFLELNSFQTYASAMRSLAVPPATPLGTSLRLSEFTISPSKHSLEIHL